jgi:serine/threonine protein kinase
MIRRPPLYCLSSQNILSVGSIADVYEVGEEVVLKSVSRFENEDIRDFLYRKCRLQHEIFIYGLFKAVPQRNLHILSMVATMTDGIFLPRMRITLEERIVQQLPSQDTQLRWIEQLVSGLAWIEERGWAHGDLRPANILLDNSDNVKISDFDSTVKPGERLLVANTPFCKLGKGFQIPIAGPLTEQFAIASCICTIRTGREPFYELEDREKVLKIMSSDYPLTADDLIFDQTMQRCWRGGYASVAELKIDVDCVGIVPNSWPKLTRTFSLHHFLFLAVEQQVLCRHLNAYKRAAGLKPF